MHEFFLAQRRRISTATRESQPGQKGEPVRSDKQEEPVGDDNEVTPIDVGVKSESHSGRSDTTKSHLSMTARVLPIVDNCVSRFTLDRSTSYLPSEEWAVGSVGDAGQHEMTVRECQRLHI